MLATMSISTVEATVPIWVLDTMDVEKWELGKIFFFYKFENENCECIKVTTTHQGTENNRSPHGSSTQRENTAPGGVLQPAPRQNVY